MSTDRDYWPPVDRSTGEAGSATIDREGVRGTAPTTPQPAKVEAAPSRSGAARPERVRADDGSGAPSPAAGLSDPPSDVWSWAEQQPLVVPGRKTPLGDRLSPFAWSPNPETFRKEAERLGITDPAKVVEAYLRYERSDEWLAHLSETFASNMAAIGVTDPVQIGAAWERWLHDRPPAEELSWPSRIAKEAGDALRSIIETPRGMIADSLSSLLGIAETVPDAAMPDAVRGVLPEGDAEMRAAGRIAFDRVLKDKMGIQEPAPGEPQFGEIAGSLVAQAGMTVGAAAASAPGLGVLLALYGSSAAGGASVDLDRDSLAWREAARAMGFDPDEAAAMPDAGDRLAKMAVHGVAEAGVELVGQGVTRAIYGLAQIPKAGTAVKPVRDALENAGAWLQSLRGIRGGATRLAAQGVEEGVEESVTAAVQGGYDYAEGWDPTLTPGDVLEDMGMAAALGAAGGVVAAPGLELLRRERRKAAGRSVVAAMNAEAAKAGEERQAAWEAYRADKGIVTAEGPEMILSQLRDAMAASSPRAAVAIDPARWTQDIQADPAIAQALRDGGFRAHADHEGNVIVLVPMTTVKGREAWPHVSKSRYVPIGGEAAVDETPAETPEEGVSSTEGVSETPAATPDEPPTGHGNVFGHGHRDGQPIAGAYVIRDWGGAVHDLLPYTEQTRDAVRVAAERMALETGGGAIDFAGADGMAKARGVARSRADMLRNAPRADRKGDRQRAMAEDPLRQDEFLASVLPEISRSVEQMLGRGKPPDQRRTVTSSLVDPSTLPASTRRVSEQASKLGVRLVPIRLQTEDGKGVADFDGMALPITPGTVFVAVDAEGRLGEHAARQVLWHELVHRMQFGDEAERAYARALISADPLGALRALESYGEKAGVLRNGAQPSLELLLQATERGQEIPAEARTVGLEEGSGGARAVSQAMDQAAGVRSEGLRGALDRMHATLARWGFHGKAVRGIMREIEARAAGVEDAFVRTLGRSQLFAEAKAPPTAPARRRRVRNASGGDERQGTGMASWRDFQQRSQDHLITGFREVDFDSLVDVAATTEEGPKQFSKGTRAQFEAWLAKIGGKPEEIAYRLATLDAATEYYDQEKALAIEGVVSSPLPAAEPERSMELSRRMAHRMRESGFGRANPSINKYLDAGPEGRAKLVMSRAEWMATLEGFRVELFEYREEVDPDKIALPYDEWQNQYGFDRLPVYMGSPLEIAETAIQSWEVDDSTLPFERAINQAVRAVREGLSGYEIKDFDELREYHRTSFETSYRQSLRADEFIPEDKRHAFGFVAGRSGGNPNMMLVEKATGRTIGAIAFGKFDTFVPAQFDSWTDDRRTFKAELVGWATRGGAAGDFMGWLPKSAYNLLAYAEPSHSPSRDAQPALEAVVRLMLDLDSGDVDGNAIEADENGMLAPEASRDGGVLPEDVASRAWLMDNSIDESGYFGLEPGTDDRETLKGFVEEIAAENHWEEAEQEYNDEVLRDAYDDYAREFKHRPDDDGNMPLGKPAWFDYMPDWAGLRHADHADAFTLSLNLMIGEEGMADQANPSLPVRRGSEWREPHNLGTGTLAHVRGAFMGDALLVGEVQSKQYSEIQEQTATVAGEYDAARKTRDRNQEIAEELRQVDRDAEKRLRTVAEIVAREPIGLTARSLALRTRETAEIADAMMADLRPWSAPIEPSKAIEAHQAAADAYGNHLAFVAEIMRMSIGLEPSETEGAVPKLVLYSDPAERRGRGNAFTMARIALDLVHAPNRHANAVARGAARAAYEGFGVDLRIQLAMDKPTAARAVRSAIGPGEMEWQRESDLTLLLDLLSTANDSINRNLLEHVENETKLANSLAAVQTFGASIESLTFADEARAQRDRLSLLFTIHPQTLWALLYRSHEGTSDQPGANPENLRKAVQALFAYGFVDGTDEEFAKRALDEWSPIPGGKRNAVGAVAHLASAGILHVEKTAAGVRWRFDADALERAADVAALAALDAAEPDLRGTREARGRPRPRLTGIAPGDYMSLALTITESPSLDPMHELIRKANPVRSRYFARTMGFKPKVDADPIDFRDADAEEMQRRFDETKPVVTTAMGQISSILDAADAISKGRDVTVERWVQHHRNTRSILGAQMTHPRRGVSVALFRSDPEAAEALNRAVGWASVADAQRYVSGQDSLEDTDFDEALLDAFDFQRKLPMDPLVAEEAQRSRSASHAQAAMDAIVERNGGQIPMDAGNAVSRELAVPLLTSPPKSDSATVLPSQKWLALVARTLLVATANRFNDRNRARIRVTPPTPIARATGMPIKAAEGFYGANGALHRALKDASKRMKAGTVVHDGAADEVVVTLSEEDLKRLRDARIPLFSRRTKPTKDERPLVARHNMTAADLRQMLDDGGRLVTPSIAVTPAATPFTGFGPISLVLRGDAFSLSHPTFDRDVWSARHPQRRAKWDRKAARFVRDPEVRRIADDAFWSAGGSNPHRFGVDWNAYRREFETAYARSETGQRALLEDGMAPDRLAEILNRGSGRDLNYHEIKQDGAYRRAVDAAFDSIVGLAIKPMIDATNGRAAVPRFVEDTFENRLEIMVRSLRRGTRGGEEGFIQSPSNTIGPGIARRFRSLEPMRRAAYERIPTDQAGVDALKKRGQPLPSIGRVADYVIDVVKSMDDLGLGFGGFGSTMQMLEDVTESLGNRMRGRRTVSEADLASVGAGVLMRWGIGAEGFQRALKRDRTGTLERIRNAFDTAEWRSIVSDLTDEMRDFLDPEVEYFEQKIHGELTLREVAQIVGEVPDDLDVRVRAMAPWVEIVRSPDDARPQPGPSAFFSRTQQAGAGWYGDPSEDAPAWIPYLPTFGEGGVWQPEMPNRADRVAVLPIRLEDGWDGSPVEGVDHGSLTRIANAGAVGRAVAGQARRLMAASVFETATIKTPDRRDPRIVHEHAYPRGRSVVAAVHSPDGTIGLVPVRFEEQGDRHRIVVPMELAALDTASPVKAWQNVGNPLIDVARDLQARSAGRAEVTQALKVAMQGLRNMGLLPLGDSRRRDSSLSWRNDELSLYTTVAWPSATGFGMRVRVSDHRPYESTMLSRWRHGPVLVIDPDTANAGELQERRQRQPGEWAQSADLAKVYAELGRLWSRPASMAAWSRQLRQSAEFQPSRGWDLIGAPRTALFSWRGVRRADLRIRRAQRIWLGLPQNETRDRVLLDAMRRLTDAGVTRRWTDPYFRQDPDPLAFTPNPFMAVTSRGIRVSLAYDSMFSDAEFRERGTWPIVENQGGAWIRVIVPQDGFSDETFAEIVDELRRIGIQNGSVHEERLESARRASDFDRRREIETLLYDVIGRGFLGSEGYDTLTVAIEEGRIGGAWIWPGGGSYGVAIHVVDGPDAGEPYAPRVHEPEVFTPETDLRSAYEAGTPYAGIVAQSRGIADDEVPKRPIRFIRVEVDPGSPLVASAGIGSTPDAPMPWLTRLIELAGLEGMVERPRYGPEGEPPAPDGSGLETIEVAGVQRPLRDSWGRVLGGSEAGARNFWSWFLADGEPDRHVLDQHGRPRVFLHGTQRDFEGDLKVPWEDNLSLSLEFGLHFATDPSVTNWFSSYGDVFRGRLEDRINRRARTYPVFVRAKRGSVVDVRTAPPPADDWSVRANQGAAGDTPAIALRLKREALRLVVATLEDADASPEAIDHAIRVAEGVAGRDRISARRHGVTFDRDHVHEVHEWARSFHPNEDDSVHGTAAVISFLRKGGVEGVAYANTVAREGTGSEAFIFGVAENMRSAIAAEFAPGRERDYGLMLSRRTGIPGAADGFMARLVDRFHELGREQRRFENMSGTELPEQADAYLAARLLPGRLVSRGIDLRRRIERLLARGADLLVEPQYAGELLYAQHARERNEYVRGINPAMPDGGSGMTDADADATLALAQARPQWPEIEALLDDWRGVLEDALDARLDAGLISQDSYDAMRKRYSRYVPLRGRPGEPDEPAVAGGGRGVSSDSRGLPRALGRQSRAEDVLAQVAIVAADAWRRIERNAVGNRVGRFAAELGDPEIMRFVRPRRRVLQGGVVRFAHDPGWRDDPTMFGYYADADFTAPDGYRYSKGDEVVLEVRQPRLAEALTRSPETMGAFGQAIEAVNRVWKLMTTGELNPAFAPVNLARDAQTAVLNQASKRGFDRGRRVAQLAPWAFATVMRQRWLRKDRSGWYDRFTKAGGDQGYWSREDRDELAKAFDAAHKALSAGASPESVGNLRRALGWYPAFFAAAETASRLATFRAAVEAGESDSKAALLARDATVDFARRGFWSTNLNTLYVFSNAGIQGSAQVLASLAFQRGVGLAATIALAGFMLAEYGVIGGGDDEESGTPWWDLLPEYTKQASMPIMDPRGTGKFIAIPSPYGWNVFGYMGMLASDVRRGRKSPSEAFSALLESALNSFNPIGGSGIRDQLAASVAPTFARPIIELSTNRDFANRPIVPETGPGAPPERRSSLAYPNTPQAFIGFSEWLNSATGGDPVRPGSIDVSPEVWEYLVGYYLSGTGRILNQAVTLSQEGLEQGVRSVPVVSRLAGDVARNPLAIRTEYWAIRDASEYAARTLDRAADDQRIDVDADLERFPNAHTMIPTVQAAERRLRDLRKRTRDAEDEQTRRDLREEQTEIMRQVVREYRELPDSTARP